jgi:hypothetical protein
MGCRVKRGKASVQFGAGTHEKYGALKTGEPERGAQGVQGRRSGKDGFRFAFQTRGYRGKFYRVLGPIVFREAFEDAAYFS